MMSGEPRWGRVGMTWAAGETAYTQSGRVTTPFPRIDMTTDRRAANTIRRTRAWLMENARAEAEARGIPFYVDTVNPQQADRELAEAILFHPAEEF